MGVGGGDVDQALVQKPARVQVAKKAPAAQDGGVVHLKEHAFQLVLDKIGAPWRRGQAGVALHMGDHRQKAGAQYAFQRLVERVKAHTGHELHQHVFRARQRGHAPLAQQAAGHVRIEDLRAQEDAQIHVVLAAGGADVLQAATEFFLVDELYARCDVRRGKDDPRAAVVGALRHHQRHLQVLRAVVYVVEQVVVYVNKSSHHRIFFAEPALAERLPLGPALLEELLEPLREPPLEPLLDGR